MRRRDLLLVPAVTAASAFPARTQNYPERPITLITGYAPGGSTDIAARIMMERLAAHPGR